MRLVVAKSQVLLKLYFAWTFWQFILMCDRGRCQIKRLTIFIALLSFRLEIQCDHIRITFSIFGHLQHWKFGHYHKEFAKVCSKFGHILIGHFKICCRRLTFCWSCEISQNLVTLIQTKESRSRKRGIEKLKFTFCCDSSKLLLVVVVGSYFLKGYLDSSFAWSRCH